MAVISLVHVPGAALGALGVLLVLFGTAAAVFGGRRRASPTGESLGEVRLSAWLAGGAALAAVWFEARGLRSLAQGATPEPSMRSSMAAPRLGEALESPADFALQGLSFPGAASVLALALVCGIAVAGSRVGVGAGLRAGASFVALGAGLSLTTVRSLMGVAALLAVVSIMEFAAMGAAGRLPRGRRPGAGALVSLLVGLVSAGLVAWGAALRVGAGGSGAVEWIGTPFAGDPSATLLLLGVMAPLALPSFLGGAFALLARLPGGAAGETVAYAALGLVRPLALSYLLAELFAGFEPLGKLGVGLVWLMALVGLMVGPEWRSQGARLAALAQGALWALLAGLATAATSRTPDALALGLFGWVLPAAGLALALGLLAGERERVEGLAPEGLGRLFPLSLMGSVVSGLALAGAPFLLAFHGRTRSAGALNSDGGGAEALWMALGSAPLFAVVLLPWLHATFFGRPPSLQDSALTVPVARRRKEPLPLLTACLLSAALSLLGGALPGFFPRLLDGLVPFNDLAPEGLPSPLGQLQLLLGAALAATFLRRRLFRRPGSLSSAR